MDTNILNESVIRFMEEQGWYNGRRFNVSKWIEQLVKEGYTCFPYAIEVLEELGGLDIKPKRNIRTGNSHPAEFHFNAFDAGSGEFDRIDVFESLAGEPLFPLGEIYQEFLYVGLSKRIYMGCYKLFVIGNSIEYFLNNVVLGLRKPIQLQYRRTN
ncbi:SUKH-3 domain-containing protein [Clostridium beijerinckii]|uniref:SUKH-3 domain-containing protein n=1 Tax=Clostridium beijerinckii TaxID=1520 RepID=UPI0014940C9E|nr:SUKH-3 domain-containing protein [Clostridium beijerinckii]NOW04853.1 hypothetical protein [Clostridium beijerinckii]NRT72526.1 hypothetical protein [Clostridium beijerinckii]NYC02004.1 hypothetical protein [Clostridium beijerinckii]